MIKALISITLYDILRLHLVYIHTYAQTMGRTIVQEHKVNKRGRRPRRQRIIRPLNLPPEIWQQYTKSLKENSQQKNTHTAETNLPKRKESKSENKLVIKEEKSSSTSKTAVDAVCCNSVGNEPSILKQLSVKIDNSYAIQFNCLFLKENLYKALEIHKSIYEKVMNAKQAFIKFSVLTVIHNEENELSDHIILAESELDVALNLLEKQELLLLNLQKTFHEISVPLSVLTCYKIEQDNMLRMSACISKKQNEIDDLKQKNDSLENKIRNNEQKLLKTRQTYQKIIKTKDQLYLETKCKLYLMMKRIRMMNKSNSRKNIVHNNAETLKIQAKLENLMAQSIKLTESLKGNILKNQSQTCSTCNNELAIKSQDEIIDNLNNQLRDLRKQNKQKDNEIHTLIISSRQLNGQILAIQQSSKLQEKQYKFETAKLTSCMDNLRRKQDRWLTDRFFQTRHSIMLFEKIKQMEMQQSKKTVFCLNKIKKDSDDAALPET